MEKAPTISRSDAEQLRLTLTECITEIDRMRALMKEDDVEIARSQARTWALIEEVRAMRLADRHEAI